MADNDQNNDEYNFADLDSLENQSLRDEEASFHTTATGQGIDVERTNVKRNALIVIALIILAMVLYKLAGVFFPEKNDIDTTQSTVMPMVQEPLAPTIKPTPTPITVSQSQPIENRNDNQLKEKISSLEQSQQNNRSEINAVGQQVLTVNNTINNLNTQIAKLNQVVENLSNQVVKQSEEISVLTTKSAPKIHKIIKHRIKTQPIIYYIQAVIPGRAWLIGSNGSTLTVREGTKISRYGTVKLIDSLQGRVLTSSGHIIRFSQEDS